MSEPVRIAGNAGVHPPETRQVPLVWYDDDGNRRELGTAIVNPDGSFTADITSRIGAKLLLDEHIPHDFSIKMNEDDIRQWLTSD